MTVKMQWIGRLLLLWGYTVCPALWAGQMVIVPSGDAEPYQVAQQALVKELSQNGHAAEVVPFEQILEHPDALDEINKYYVAIGTKAAVHLHQAIRSPDRLFYCMVAGPVDVGLHKNPPVQGISTDTPLKIQFQLMAQVIPDMKSLGVLYKSKTEEGKRLIEELKKNLPPNWQLQMVALEEYDNISLAIEALFAQDVAMVWTYPDPAIFDRATIKTILLTSIRKKIPVFGYSQVIVKAGALLGVAIDPEVQGQQAAQLVHRTVTAHQGSGQPPPPETAVDIALNLIVAEQFHLEIPAEVIKKAKYLFKQDETR